MGGSGSGSTPWAVKAGAGFRSSASQVRTQTRCERLSMHPEELSWDRLLAGLTRFAPLTAHQEAVQLQHQEACGEAQVSKFTCGRHACGIG